MNYMLFIRVSLLGLFGFIGSVFGMKHGSELSVIIAQPTVKKVFSQNKVDTVFTKYNDDYSVVLDDNDNEKKNKVANLLAIIKKQLNNLNLIEGDIVQLSYTDINVTNDMNNESIIECNFKMQYTQLTGTPWFSQAKIMSKCEFSARRKILNLSDSGHKSNYSYTVYNSSNQPIADGINNNIVYDWLVSRMKEHFLLYLIKDQIIAEITACTLTLEGLDAKKDEKLIEDKGDYDIGYDNCELDIETCFYSTIYSDNNLLYRIQDLDHTQLEQMCEKKRQFILIVKNLTNNNIIKMKVKTVSNGSKGYTLNPAQNNVLSVVHATLVDKDHPYKFTFWQGLMNDLWPYEGLVAVTGCFSLLMLAMLIYCNKG